MKKIILTLTLLGVIIFTYVSLPSVDASGTNLFNMSNITSWVYYGGMPGQTTLAGINYSDSSLVNGKYRMTFTSNLLDGTPNTTNSKYTTNSTQQTFAQAFTNYSCAMNNCTFDAFIFNGQFSIFFANASTGNVWKDYYSMSNTAVVITFIEAIDEIDPVFTYSTARIDTPYHNLISVASIQAQLSVIDDVDGDISDRIVIESDNYTSVTPKVVGTEYPVIFSATDNAGNKAFLTVYVKVIDDLKPYATRSGTTYQHGSSLSLPSWYNDSPTGSKLTLDQIKALFSFGDGYYQSNLLTVTMSVNYQGAGNYYDVPGNHVVTMKVKDPSNNESTITINVTVLANQTPVVSGPSTQTVEITNFTIGAILAQYTATDAEDGALPVSVGSGGTWNYVSPTLGTFTLVVKATDQFGKVGTKTVTVTVRDTTIPTFKIGGTTYSTYTHNVYQSNTSSLNTLLNSIEVHDAYYGNITGSKVIGTLPNLTTPGSKTMTVTATDASNNTGTLTITVVVIDNVPPVINGAVKIVKGQTTSLTVDQIKSQLSAVDNVSGPLSLVLVSDNYTANSTVVGRYTVVFKATDAASNETQHTVDVWVTDNVAPIFIINDYLIPLSMNQSVTRAQLITLLESAGMIVTDLSYNVSFVNDQYTGNENSPGTYNVTMLVTYENGSQDVLTVSLLVPDGTEAPSINWLDTLLKVGLSTASAGIVLISVLVIFKRKR